MKSRLARVRTKTNAIRRIMRHNGSVWHRKCAATFCFLLRRLIRQNVAAAAAHAHCTSASLTLNVLSSATDSHATQIVVQLAQCRALVARVQAIRPVLLFAHSPHALCEALLVLLLKCRREATTTVAARSPCRRHITMRCVSRFYYAK